jgi:hypothetical protein
MDQNNGALTASAQNLTLNKGLYLISIKSASPRRVGDDAEFYIPAIHVGPAPGAPAGQMEILSGPRNNGHWLFEDRDMVVVKISSGPANVLLMTLRADSMPNLEVAVQRIDGKSNSASVQPAAAQPAAAAIGLPAPAPADPARGLVPTASTPPRPPMRDAQGRTPLRTEIKLHIQLRGDVKYVDNFWAGALGERLAIEAFNITPLEGLQPDQIEYKALTESGVETGWISGGGDCGSRGHGLALNGFAVRLKSGQTASYDCEYRGSFSSGKIVGPSKNGAPCRGEPGDKLEAIQLLIVERSANEALTGVTPPPPRPAIEAPAVESRPPGPRFSVFRENVE